MEHSYYPNHEDIGPELRISITTDEHDAQEAFEQIRQVRSAEDIARIGRAHDQDDDAFPEHEAEEFAFESVDASVIESHRNSFLSLFPNRFASCIKRGKQGGWKMTSQYHYLSDEEIIESISGDLSFLRAVMPDMHTRFFAITLSEGSFYRGADGLEKLRDCLRCVGINQIKNYTSSDGGDWHIFVFFKKPVESEKVTSLMSAWLRRNGIVPGTAGVCIFPGSEPFCLPLQPGFSWINDDGHVIVARNQIAPEAALALFVADIERIAIDGHQLIERLSQILARG